MSSSQDVFWIDDSVLDRFQLMKKRRISYIRKMLEKLGKIDLKIFIANVSVNCGIDGRTVRNYLRDLEIIGDIEIKDGMMIWKARSMK